MRKIPLKLLRLFTILLLTVFVAESVLANAMIATELKFPASAGLSPSAELSQISDNKSLVNKSSVNKSAVNQNNHSAHCHDMPSHNKSSVQQDQSHHTQPASKACEHCSHCLACFSMIPTGQFNQITMQTPLTAMTVFVEIYFSPASAQPQKPPIA